MDLHWRQIYNTGVDKIDAQHKQLFSLIKEIYEAPMHEKGIKLKCHVEALLDYAQYHFAEEEKYWDKINLPKDMIDHHRKEHKKYVIELNTIINNSIGEGMIMSMEAIDFLKDWIIDHILGEDQEFVEFAKDCNEV